MRTFTYFTLPLFSTRDTTAHLPLYTVDVVQYRSYSGSARTYYDSVGLEPTMCELDGEKQHESAAVTCFDIITKAYATIAHFRKVVTVDGVWQPDERSSAWL